VVTLLTWVLHVSGMNLCRNNVYPEYYVIFLIASRYMRSLDIELGDNNSFPILSNSLFSSYRIIRNCRYVIRDYRLQNR